MLLGGKYLYWPGISPVGQFSVIVFTSQLTLTCFSKVFLVFCCCCWILVFVFVLGVGFALLFTECLACAKYHQEQMVKTSSNSWLSIRVKRFPERRGPWSSGVGRMGAALGEVGTKGGSNQSYVSFPGPQRSPRIFCGTENSKVHTRDCRCLAFL